MAEKTNIHFIAPIETMKAMKDLVRIGLKAHGNNPSPVDIKLELDKLDTERLMQIDEDLTRIIKANP